MLLVDQISWQANFMIMAAFMLVGVLLALLVKEPKQYSPPPASLREAVQVPFQEFFQRRSIGPALAVLAFMALYKLGDNMATALASPFYLDMQFTTTQIGIVAKQAALWPSIIGGLVGALVIVKIGINKALWVFGFIQFATMESDTGGSISHDDKGHRILTIAFAGGLSSPMFGNDVENKVDSPSLLVALLGCIASQVSLLHGRAQIHN